MTDKRTGPVTLSVIIPTYQRPDALNRILASLGEQITRNPEYNVIVVNDGSHNRAYANVLAKHPYVNYVTHENNRGGGAARNTGARQATGRYLVFTDDDCIPTPYWLDFLVAIIHEYPWLAAIAGPTRLYPVESPSMA
ncbi:MAG: glycosyltransferase, partial [Thiotrichales bacterium]|nr:glycosyltransferase [Thiotrichales bacterium]